SNGHIVLYGFGGLAIGSSELPNRWQRIAVYFAGPGAQFLIFGIIWLVARSDLLRSVPSASRELVIATIFNLYVINLFWPILNLLPIWPLDGGRICRDFLGWCSPGKNVSLSLGISILTAGFLAINSLAGMNGKPLVPYVYVPDMFMVMFFALMAVQSYQ